MDNTTTDRRIGHIIDGRYRLTGLIATGGMAAVYEAFDQRLDRTVAVKIISEAHADTDEFLAAFRQEAKTIARLSHPNVVGVFDQGSHEGLPYVVMELVKGITLRDLLNQRRYLSVPEAVEITRQTLEALEAAHSTGLIHRDIKPENILLKEGGKGDRVKVADFGLAEAIQSLGTDGQGRGPNPDKPLLATAAYVAPELVLYQPARPQSDVYAVGVMLFELLTGEVPFDGEDPGQVAQRHVSEDIPSPKTLRGDVPQSLANLTLAATRRDIDQRPVDAGDFGRRLQHIKTANPTTTIGPRPTQNISTAKTTYVPMAQRSGSSPAAQTWMKIGLVAGVLLLLAGLGWWAGFGQYTDTPSLLGQDRETVEEYANERGFTIEFDDGAYSNRVPVDDVFAQEPAAGDRIRSGGTITVTLSLGPEQFTMPDLAGASEEEALNALAKDVNAEVIVVNGYSDTVPQGHVISTEPGAGRTVNSGSAVEVMISDGRAPVTTPEVLSLSEEDARASIERAGLTVGEVDSRYSDSIPEGHVIEQSPRGGEGIGVDGVVDLVLSDGPEPIQVPNVTDMSIEQATEELESLGFVVRVFDLINGDTVFRQSEEAGSTAPKGSTIWIWVR
ncbi:Stk1 family PASTA domain-containing Ser/Thr kinase [Natronoglycomyces albus]|uniref:non-specific serine/threonine protein kinase n=1 Tax=Natronoglycomyces albus TaxID=2811108 RepID=A0A895XRE3_9ACTN|nr:Stk1 family PASTA domain-containing Ser/Thr kinase [Natronoglycomyces albus]QSB06282.1 PASTA domain-containing protein [Natronoglycomyces albus]